MYEHQISIICIDISDDYIDTFLKKQNYENIEIAKVEKNDSIQTIIDYLGTTQSQYFCFLEPGYNYSDNFTSKMLASFDKDPTIDVVITPRSFIAPDNTIISKIDPLCIPFSNASPMYGNAFLTYCVNNDINMYGSLATLMVSTEYARSLNWCLFSSDYKCIELLSFLFNLLYSSTAFLLNAPLVSKLLEPFIDEAEVKSEYDKCISFFRNQKMLFSQTSEPLSHIKKTVQKDITFFYSDKGEYYNLEPIAKEAEKRGYKTTFTDQLEENAERIFQQSFFTIWLRGIIAGPIFGKLNAGIYLILV